MVFTCIVKLITSCANCVIGALCFSHKQQSLVGDISKTVILFILEWTTCLDSSSGTLICPSLCPRHVGRNNYVPLFGVDPIEWRLTRYYVIRDVIVIFEC